MDFMHKCVKASGFSGELIGGGGVFAVGEIGAAEGYGMRTGNVV
jgi:hypothetical protein